MLPIPHVMAVDTPKRDAETDANGDAPPPSLIQFLETIGASGYRPRPAELKGVEFYVPPHETGIPAEPQPAKVGKSKKSKRAGAQKNRDARRAAKKMEKEHAVFRAYQHGGPRVSQGIFFLLREPRAPDYWEFLGQAALSTTHVRRMFRFAWVYGDFMVVQQVEHDEPITGLAMPDEKPSVEGANPLDEALFDPTVAYLEVFVEIVTRNSKARPMTEVPVKDAKGRVLTKYLSVHAPDSAHFMFELRRGPTGNVKIDTVKARVERDVFVPDPEGHTMAELTGYSDESIQDFARDFCFKNAIARPDQLEDKPAGGEDASATASEDAQENSVALTNPKKVPETTADVPVAEDKAPAPPQEDPVADAVPSTTDADARAPSPQKLLEETASKQEEEGANALPPELRDFATVEKQMAKDMVSAVTEGFKTQILHAEQLTDSDDVRARKLAILAYSAMDYTAIHGEWEEEAIARGDVVMGNLMAST